MKYKASVPLSDRIEPLLAVDEDDDDGLGEVINQVAEALAALGFAIVNRQGRPLSGVSDERAVVAILEAYVAELAKLGRNEEAVIVTDLARRVGRLGRRPRFRPI
jgi:hypothetical protein